MLRRKPKKQVVYALDDEPDPLADEIREQFISQRKAIYPHAAPIGRLDRVFRQAASRCRANGMSAAEYVRAAVQTALQLGVPLYPQSLLVRVDKPSMEANLLRIATYRAHLGNFEGMLPIYGARMLLEDNRSPLPPLLRYVLATKYSLPEVIAATTAAARQEGLTLNTFMQKLFQAELRKLGVI